MAVENILTCTRDVGCQTKPAAVTVLQRPPLHCPIMMLPTCTTLTLLKPTFASTTEDPAQLQQNHYIDASTVKTVLVQISPSL